MAPHTHTGESGPRPGGSGEGGGRGWVGEERGLTSVVAELDVRLGAVGVEVGGGGPGVDGLGVQLGGELEVVVDEGLLGLAPQIRRGHGAPSGLRRLRGWGREGGETTGSRLGERTE